MAVSTNGLVTNNGGSLWVGPKFNPASLFAASEQGAWYDPTTFSTMFQNAAGTTPVTAVEQAVGLILDRSKGLVLGPEAWTGFGTITSPWTNAGGGVFTIDGSQAGNRDLSQNPQFTTNKRYLVTFTLSGVTGGTLQVFVGEGSGVSLGNGSYTYRANASQAYLIFRAPAGVAATVSAVSVKELPGNHAFQSTDASRPTLRARYNLLTYSEQFDNAAWFKSQATVTQNAAVAPDGTTTGDKIEETAVTNVHLTSQTLTVVSSTNYTLTCYCKAAERTIARLDLVHAGVANYPTYFDLSGAGSVLSQSSGNSSTITLVGNGWYRVSLTRAMGAAQTSTIAQIGPSPSDLGAGTSGLYVGVLGSGIYIWGAQLMTLGDANATNNAYQRIAAATDYVTTSTMGGYQFSPYLSFDGSDDSLLTNSVDFSATDKMTVWAGVTKLSDAATGTLVELSATWNDVINNGTFAMFAPFSSLPASYRWNSKGTSGSSAPFGASSFASAPVSNVLTGIGDIAGDATTLRSNGVQIATNTDNQGTGNYGNYPLYIGRRNNATLPLNGRLYQLIIRGAASTDDQINATETYVDQITRAY